MKKVCVHDQTCCTGCLVDVHEIHRLDDGLEREGLEVAQKVLELHSPLHCRWRKARWHALSLLGGFLHSVFGIGWRDFAARIAYGL